MKKLETTYRFHIGWITYAIWTPFCDKFSTNIIGFILNIGLGVILMCIGCWIADKICEK